MCRYIPASISAGLEPLKNDEAQVKDFGHVLGVEMCRKLLRGGTPGLHFYTLNLEVSDRTGVATMRPWVAGFSFLWLRVGAAR